MDKDDMTKISKNHMEFLSGGEKTPGELIDFLQNEAAFCSFDQVLKQVYPNDDLADRLTAGLAEIRNEPLPNVARKVQNWIKGRNIPKNRETLFQICFVLGLDELRASRILGTASETGIHYRNRDELAYAFGLRTGMSYEQAAALKERVQRLYPMLPHKEADDEKEQVVYTRQLRDAFFYVTSEDELMEFFDEHIDDLGQLHETAYQKFEELMELLQKPEGISGAEERRYTIEEVMETYMRMHVPETKKTANYTLLQRVIKKYWPNESGLLNMKNRKEDVSRKVMILLYLVTEAFDDEEDEDDNYFDLAKEDADTVLEIRLERMNLFLDRYGMNLLDVGSPFDFLVLYAMRTQGGECVSDRMAAVLNSLFESEQT